VAIIHSSHNITIGGLAKRVPGAWSHDYIMYMLIKDKR